MPTLAAHPTLTCNNTLLDSQTGACTNVMDAANLVKKNLLSDRESPDLASKINVNSIYTGSSSGMKDEDYPLDGLSLPLLSDVRHVPLPPELIEQFGHMQCNCIIGIFPEIGRAWLTVDSDIFVWNYSEGDDLAYFDGLAETILSVALVLPKGGIFKEHIKYLLVLTTPLDVVILGVSFVDNDINNEMQLIPDPLFTLSSDGTQFLHTVGTKTGRIFAGGKDGCLYEITYQAVGGWFSRKCTKVNHSRSRLSFLLPSVVNLWMSEEDPIAQVTVDDTRNILYTRSQKGTISVFDLGLDGLSTNLVAQLRLDSIQKKAKVIAPGIEPSNLNELVYISPITRQQSRHVHLVAVTQAGVRLYFLTCQIVVPDPVSGVVDPTKSRPNNLCLVHVRLPPGFTSSSVVRPTAVHAAFHNNGCLLLSGSNGEDGIIWFVNSDMFSFEKTLKEMQCNFPIDGRSWAISEVPYPSSPLLLAALPLDNTSHLPPDPPVHVVQHVQKTNEYVIITSQGCHMFNKLRPVDQLRYLLQTVSDPDSDTINAFFRLYKEGEAMVCCIILAMSAVPADRQIAEQAIAVFLHHGGIVGKLATASRPAVAPHPADAPFSPIGQRQVQNTSMLSNYPQMPVFSTPMPGSQVNSTAYSPSPYTASPVAATIDTSPLPALGALYLSERQQGVYKLFARIVRPLWDGKLVQDFVVTESGKTKTFVTSRTEVEVISLILDDLSSFKSFLKQYCLTPAPIRDFYVGLKDRSTIGRTIHGRADGMTTVQLEQHKKNLMENQVNELSYMKHLYNLINLTVQVLGLWKLILHHQLHILYQCLDKNSQASLKTMTFSDLILNGNSVCGALISVLVGQYIDDHSTVDALSCQLRDVCPDLYSPDDVICSKASELLTAARTSLPAQRLEQLSEASNLLKQIAHSVNLIAMTQQFQAVRFYSGAVELCMKAAELRDKEGLALRLYHSAANVNDPDIDPEFRKAYESRAECYKCIIDLLDDLMLAAESHPQSPSVPTQPGPPQITPATNGTTLSALYGALSPEDAQQQAENCLQLALKSNDELLHVNLYQWMLGKQLTAQLLRVTSPFIEAFLKRVVANEDENPAPTSMVGSQLLWQYYERNGEHNSAAQILSNLAEKPGADRDLTQRIEFLSRAKINAKSVTSATADSHQSGKLLNELEEKLEVAQIQLKTLEQLQELGEKDAVVQLNSCMADMSTLYSEFAERYQLAECKLAISHCAGVYNEPLITTLWQNIVEYELAKPSSSSAANKPALLKLKIIELGKQYFSTQRYFPIDFLAVYLEKMSCENDWGLTWVITCFLDIGVPLQSLLSLYEKINSQKLPDWAAIGSPHHLIYVINELINIFLDNPVDHSFRSQLACPALDSLVIHIVNLGSINMPTEKVRQLIASLRRTQASLQDLMDRTSRS